MTYTLKNGKIFSCETKIPNERKWLAMDDDGKICAFIEIPTLSEGMWVRSCHEENYFIVGWAELEDYDHTNSLTPINRLEEKLDKILME